MGIFNFFIVIPQIINGLFGGPIVSGIFGKQAMDYVVVGGACMLIGALVTMIFVKSEDETLKKLKKRLNRFIFSLKKKKTEVRNKTFVR